MIISESDAREAALQLWSGWHLHSTITAGLRTNREAMQVAFAAADDVSILPDHSRSPSGVPMDFVTPTPWHAACYTLAAALSSRISQVSFDDDIAFAKFFGHRAVFRGQARGWQIRPTAWRHSFETSRALKAVRDYINTFTTDEDAVEFELFGRLRSDRDTAALAQHYGVPTNLVDFTFDPMAAVFFALGECQGPATGVDGPADHAVIFTAPLHKLAALGGIQFSFPPVQTQRLFRQSGLFIDFGSKPTTDTKPRSFEQPWTWFEQNCARIFFPRIYPQEPSHSVLNAEYFLAPDQFLSEVVAAAKAYAESDDTSDCLAFVNQRVATRPPWRVASLDGGGIYTDEEFLLIGQMIERYLVLASLVHTSEGPCYDPVLLGLIANTDDRILRSIYELAQLQGTSLGALIPAADEIRRSFLRLQQAMSGGPDW